MGGKGNVDGDENVKCAMETVDGVRAETRHFDRRFGNKSEEKSHFQRQDILWRETVCFDLF